MTSDRLSKKYFEAAKLFAAQKKSGGKLKIGTVITQTNAGNLNNIADSVSSLNPDIWKWYELRIRGAAIDNQDSLRVDELDIPKLYDAMRVSHPSLNIHYSRSTASNYSYLIINPDSEALIPFGEGYFSFGKLVRQKSDGQYFFDDDRWQKFIAKVDKKSQFNNLDYSFPGWLND
jgi:hypothetical protein